MMSQWLVLDVQLFFSSAHGIFKSWGEFDDIWCLCCNKILLLKFAFYRHDSISISSSNSELNVHWLISLQLSPPMHLTSTFTIVKLTYVYFSFNNVCNPFNKALSSANGIICDRQELQREFILKLSCKLRATLNFNYFTTRIYIRL
jgi:hypothetical protein